MVKPSHLGSSPTTPGTFELVARGTAMNDGITSLCCPDCQVALDLHQPDPDDPTQLLGSCGCCSKWFFAVELDSEWNETLLLELPSAETIRLTHATSPLP
jgi:hypothetical protein